MACWLAVAVSAFQTRGEQRLPQARGCVSGPSRDDGTERGANSLRWLSWPLSQGAGGRRPEQSGPRVGPVLGERCWAGTEASFPVRLPGQRPSG